MLTSAPHCTGLGYLSGSGVAWVGKGGPELAPVVLRSEAAWGGVGWSFSVSICLLWPPQKTLTSLSIFLYVTIMHITCLKVQLGRMGVSLLF